MVARPSVDPIAALAAPPAAAAGSRYGLTRWKNVLLGMCVLPPLPAQPAARARAAAAAACARRSGPDSDVATHFTPRYNPWEQRLCLVPDGDFFAAISEGRASVVTDHIESFTETGIALRSGATLEADIVVTATGLEAGDARRRRARTSTAAASSLAHASTTRALMFSGVPEPGRHVRLHQRLVDAEGRPDGAVRLPPAQPHAEDRRAPMPAARGRRRHAARCRGSTSRRATSSAPPTSCPSRARPSRGS